ncbi:MAG TPA: cation-translocating P-type ATPase [Burkholderiaceae bacterium]|nr:cation-translocating P-type ATPase [Burkholderiaceae bacterium]
MPNASLEKPVSSLSLSDMLQGLGTPNARVGGAVDLRDANHPTDLKVLDEAGEWSAFSRPYAKQDGCWESNIQIDGMHCAACSLTIEEALNAVPGVLQANVSAGSHRARVIWSENAAKPSDWMQAVQAVGYRAVPANDIFARERRLAEGRQSLWQLSVAGLCMMQVMMYAYPTYNAMPGDMTQEMLNLLRWASWVLTLPVLIFSCGPFFKNALKDIAQRRVSMDLPVAIGMVITFVVSTMGTFDPQGIFGKEVYFDSLTMFVFFLLAGRWLELRLRDRTAGALEALMNRMPDQVSRVKADGTVELVAVRRLQRNDVVRILPGETLPADGTVLKGDTLVDEALLTGESHPIHRSVGSAVIAGSHNLSSVIDMRIDHIGDQTRYAQIVALMQSASTSKPPIAKLADRIAKPFLIAVLFAAFLAGAYWWRHDPGHALMVAASVLIVTCPCALSLATPAAMLAAAGALAKQGVMVRNLSSFEALAKVDTVVFDKTGTLTRDAMVLSQTTVRNGVSQQQVRAWAAALAQNSLHPVSKALVAAAKNTAEHRLDLQDVTEVAGGGVMASAMVHGQTVLLRLGSATFCDIAQSQRSRSNQVQAYLADDQGWLATFDLIEDVREDAQKTVKALQLAGMTVHLLSGDGAQAAARVAQQVGINDYQGACTPQDKLAFLQQQKSAGRKVAVVGDGLNDGPMLAGAHVSFAFGQAVPLAQAQSDFVVLGGKLEVVARAANLAKETLKIVKQNLWWAAIYNAICVPLAVFGWLPAWLAGLGMAFSSLFVVLNALRLSAADTPTSTIDAHSIGEIKHSEVD